MSFIETGKKVNKDTGKNAQEYGLKSVSTSTLLWHVVKRHRMALTTMYAIIITMVYIFPPLPDLILSLFSS